VPDAELYTRQTSAACKKLLWGRLWERGIFACRESDQSFDPGMQISRWKLALKLSTSNTLI
jgi:hypothetical protein